jgi:hypothetical protein
MEKLLKLEDVLKDSRGWGNSDNEWNHVPLPLLCVEPGASTGKTRNMGGFEVVSPLLPP